MTEHKLLELLKQGYYILQTTTESGIISWLAMKPGQQTYWLGNGSLPIRAKFITEDAPEGVKYYLNVRHNAL